MTLDDVLSLVRTPVARGAIEAYLEDEERLRFRRLSEDGSPRGLAASLRNLAA